MNKKAMLGLMVACMVLISTSGCCFWPFTYRQDLMGYHAPCWGENNTIFFIKDVTFGHGVYPYWFNAPIFWGDYLAGHSELYLCSMNHDGTEKREIIKLGDTRKGNYWLPMYMDYCEGNDMILLSGGMHPARGTVDPGIYTITTDGSSMKKVSNKGMHASWSPDGKRIVYEEGSVEEGTIWVINTDGSNDHQISKEKVLFRVERLSDEHGNLIIENGKVKCKWEERYVDKSPIWSPKDDLIAFVCDGWIWVMKADGGERRKVGEGSVGNWWIDGKMLLAELEQGGGVLIDLEGNIVKKMNWGGRLSPDGKFGVGGSFVVINMETRESITDLFADIKHPEKHFVYKRPNNIW